MSTTSLRASTGYTIRSAYRTLLKAIRSVPDDYTRPGTASLRQGMLETARFRFRNVDSTATQGAAAAAWNPKEYEAELRAVRQIAGNRISRSFPGTQDKDLGADALDKLKQAYAHEAAQAKGKKSK
jgi:hypothetical protein